MSAGPWPKRLLIAGVALILSGTVAMWAGWSDFERAMDPANNHVVALDGGQGGEVNLTAGHSYLLFRTDGRDVNCTVTEIATGTEVPRDEPSFLHGVREGADGTIYTAIGVYVAEGDGLHLVENQAAPGKELWLVDEGEIEADSNALLLLEGSCFSLLCGTCLIPLGGLLWLTGRGGDAAAGAVLTTADGTQVPIAPSADGSQRRVPTTDEVWASLRSGEPLDLSLADEAEGVPAPFADRPDATGPIPRAIDEVEVVEEALVPTEAEVEPDSVDAAPNWKSWDEG